MNASKRLKIDPLLPGFETVLKTNQTVNRLIVDYVLAVAILGVLPIYSNRWADVIGFSVTLLLNLKMVIDIKGHWGAPKRLELRSLLGNGLNFLEAFFLLVVVRLLISAIGLFVPTLVVFNVAIGHAVFTWRVGRSAHQYYFDSLSREQTRDGTLGKVENIVRENERSHDQAS